jgi:hypothetical protein
MLLELHAIVAVCAVWRKRDVASDFDIAPQQKASHIAAALRKSAAARRFSLRHTGLNWG